MTLSAVLDPQQSTMTTEPPGTVAANYTAHWIDLQELTYAITIGDHEHRDVLPKRSNLKIPDVLCRPTDLLFKVQSDGSVVVWSIQHLQDEPKRLSKVMLVLKMPDALPTEAARSLRFGMKIFSPCPSESSFLLAPFQLALLTQGHHGELAVWSWNLLEFFSNMRALSKLTLSARLAGHGDTVSMVSYHKRLPYVATTSKNGELILWKVDLASVSLHHTS